MLRKIIVAILMVCVIQTTAFLVNPREVPGWTEWEPWSTCDVTCGQGIQLRKRQCFAAGNNCTGDVVDNRPCAVHCTDDWSVWGPWSICHKPCGNGTRLRFRACQKDDGSSCQGDDSQTESCGAGSCPSWGTWSMWSSCDRTCGAGLRVRMRQCSQAELTPCSHIDHCVDGPCTG